MVKSVGEFRAAIFCKNMLDWLSANRIEYHSPHDFRRGHANYLFDKARDINDLEAARENLMHESLTTTEHYARQRRNQRKARILQMCQGEEPLLLTNLSADSLNEIMILVQALQKAIDPHMLEHLRNLACQK